MRFLDGQDFSGNFLFCFSAFLKRFQILLVVSTISGIYHTVLLSI